MATEETEQEQSPFTRPGFIAATGVIFVIVTLGVVIGILSLTDDDPDPVPSAEPSASSAAPTADPSAAAGGASVCGLTGEVLTGSLTTAPEAQWEFQGTTAYPMSSTYGPNDTDPDGVRFCFQRSPEGALFMAANSLVQATDPAVGQQWAEAVLSDGRYRDTLLADAGTTSSDSAGVRLNIAGFRLLAYDGDTARVDIAIRGAAQGETIIASAVYDLVWQSGDWKLNADVEAPFDFAPIPDLSGYIAWSQ